MEIDFMKRCASFFDKHKTEYSKIYINDLHEMYVLYNMVLKPVEKNTTCEVCRLRVYKRLKNYYENILQTVDELVDDTVHLVDVKKEAPSDLENSTEVHLVNVKKKSPRKKKNK